MMDMVLNMLLDYLSCFAMVLTRIDRKVDLCQTDCSYSLQTKTFPLFWSHAWKYNIQANEGLAKVEEKWSTIKFDVFVPSFSAFQCPRQ